MYQNLIFVADINVHETWPVTREYLDGQPTFGARGSWLNVKRHCEDLQTLGIVLKVLDEDISKPYLTGIVSNAVADFLVEKSMVMKKMGAGAKKFEIYFKSNGVKEGEEDYGGIQLWKINIENRLYTSSWMAKELRSENNDGGAY